MRHRVNSFKKKIEIIISFEVSSKHDLGHRVNSFKKKIEITSNLYGQLPLLYSHRVNSFKKKIEIIKDDAIGRYIIGVTE